MVSERNPICVCPAKMNSFRRYPYENSAKTKPTILDFNAYVTNYDICYWLYAMGEVWVS